MATAGDAVNVAGNYERDGFYRMCGSEPDAAPLHAGVSTTKLKAASVDNPLPSARESFRINLDGET